MTSHHLGVLLRNGKGRGYWGGPVPERLLPGKTGTSLGKGQATAVHGLVTPIVCPRLLDVGPGGAGNRCGPQPTLLGPSALWLR